MKEVVIMNQTPVLGPTVVLILLLLWLSLLAATFVLGLRFA
jgi:hypothetical protein